MEQNELSQEAKLALEEILKLNPDFKWKTEEDIWEAYWVITSPKKD